MLAKSRSRNSNALIEKQCVTCTATWAVCWSWRGSLNIQARLLSLLILLSVIELLDSELGRKPSSRVLRLALELLGALTSCDMSYYPRYGVSDTLQGNMDIQARVTLPTASVVEWCVRLLAVSSLQMGTVLAQTHGAQVHQGVDGSLVSLWQNSACLFQHDQVSSSDLFAMHWVDCLMLCHHTRRLRRIASLATELSSCKVMQETTMAWPWYRLHAMTDDYLMPEKLQPPVPLPLLSRASCRC